MAADASDSTSTKMIKIWYAVATVLAIICTAIVIALQANIIIPINAKQAAMAVALGLAMLALGLAMHAYLKYGKIYRHTSDLVFLDDLFKFRKELIELKNVVSSLQDSNYDMSTTLIDDERRAKLISEVRQEIESRAAEDWLKNIQENVKKEIAAETQELEQERQLEVMRRRIEFEIDELGRRGNLNLILGGCASLIGILILGYTVIAHAAKPSDPWNLIYYYLPRAGLVIVIQIFAYFFLTLYKNSLQEIKYFQNEITNIESRFMALRAIIRTKSPETIKCVLTEFATTERNHIILKGQTTVELEKAKFENSRSNELMQLLAKIVKYDQAKPEQK